MTIDINTILHTKDGRKIGNAIIIRREGFFWWVKTDYGDEVKFTEENIRKLFYIASRVMQSILIVDHKHRVI